MKKHLKVNLKVYDSLAEEYKQTIQLYKRTDKICLRKFIKYIHNSKNPVVLEIGPGSGLNSLFLSNEGFKTIGIDFSKNMVAVAKETSPNTKYICSDFLEYDFKKQKFNGVLARAVVHLFPRNDRKKFFKKIKKLLKPRGLTQIATTVHNKSEEGYFKKNYFNINPLHFRKKFTEREFLAEIEESGLKIKNIFYFYEKAKKKKWINVIAINE